MGVSLKNDYGWTVFIYSHMHEVSNVYMIDNLKIEQFSNKKGIHLYFKLVDFDS